MEIPRWLKISAGVCVLLAGYLVNLPCPIELGVYSLVDFTDIEPNTLLRKSEQLARGQLDGPESLAFRGKFIFSGLADGRIVALDTEFNQVETLLFTGNPERALPFPCGEYQTEHICGRPLGMQFDAEGNLIVADAYFGLLTVSSETANPKAKSLSKKPNDGKRAPYRFTNAVAVSAVKKGPIYFTDSSTFPRRDVALEVLQMKPGGRLLKYNPKTKKTETLLKDLYFPNGLLLAEDESYLLFAETTKARIIKYHLKGSKKGKKELWADNLPLLPDNLSWDEEAGQRNGAVWTAGGKRSSLFAFLGRNPMVRQFLATTVKPETLMDLSPKEAFTLRLDNAGNILDAPQDASARVMNPSGVYPHNESLYIGSYRKEFKFLAKIPRADLGLKVL